MSTFPLRIGTPDGLLFEGEAERVVCRSITGDLAILARHCNFCTALGMGEASVVMADGSEKDCRMYRRYDLCDERQRSLLATTWEWKEDIDVHRADVAKQKAEEKLAENGLTDQEYKLAQAKLHRALVRLSVKK